MSLSPGLRTPKTAWAGASPKGGVALGLGACIAGTLLVGGVAGLALNRTAAAEKAVAIRPAGTVMAVAETPTGAPAPQSLPRPGVVPAVAARLPEVRFTEISVPQNPFVPVAESAPVAAPKVVGLAGAPVGGAVAAMALPIGKAAAAKQTAAPRAAATPVAKPVPAAIAQPAGPSADELAVTGIIQGDPALAVVNYGGQSLFLKIGDQVADTWRLVEIKERSAIFQLGGRRVEVPIKGGSSQ